MTCAFACTPQIVTHSWHKAFFIHALTQDDVHEKKDIQRDHQQSLPAVQILLVDGEQVDDDAGYDQEDRIVDRKYIYGDRVQRGGDAQYQQDVEDIGADGISQGEVALAFSGGDDGGHQFREGCAQGHDGQSDKCLAPPKSQRDGRCAVHHQVTAEDDPRHAQNDVEEDEGDWSCGGCRSVGVVCGCVGLSGFQRLPDCKCHIDEKCGQEDDALRPGEDGYPHPPVGGRDAHEQQGPGDEDGKGKVFFQYRGLDFHGVDRCTDSDHDQEVEDVGSDHVAQGEVIFPGQGGGDADGGLRHAGPEGHDGQADDDAGDPQEAGDAGTALHEQVRAFDQQKEAQE